MTRTWPALAALALAALALAGCAVVHVRPVAGKPRPELPDPRVVRVRAEQGSETPNALPTGWEKRWSCNGT